MWVVGVRGRGDWRWYGQEGGVGGWWWARGGVVGVKG